jgi:hypothetical protein
LVSRKSGTSWAVISRKRRLTRFRYTAVPTEREAMSPTLEFCASPLAITTTASGWAYDFPKRLTRLKSIDRVNRFFCFTQYPARYFAEHLIIHQHRTFVDYQIIFLT